MYSFSYLEAVCCSMSSSNCWFLTCIQVSQEAGQVVWYSHLSEFSTVYCDPHSPRLWHSQESRNRCVSGALVFLMIQWMLAIWSLVPLPLLKPAWTSGSSWFMYCWSLAWRILSPSWALKKKNKTKQYSNKFHDTCWLEASIFVFIQHVSVYSTSNGF